MRLNIGAGGVRFAWKRFGNLRLGHPLEVHLGLEVHFGL